MSNNIVKAGFYGGRFATTRSLYQYDYGIKLKIEGLELPTVFETHFSNGEFDETTTALGRNGVVVIPDIYLTTGKMVYAFIYLHTESDDGETVYRINIPVKKRGKPIDQEATPQEQSTITQAIAELNNAINVSNTNAEYAEGYMNQAHGYSTDAYNYANTASEQAILAGQSAETAEQMKNDAIGAATRASASATRAEDNAVIAVNSANAAAQSAEDAESSAESAISSATDAAASAQSAHASAQSIQSMTVEATTLTPGSSATATWSNGTLSLGIPAGSKGDPGEGITYHVCSSGEYNASTGEPTIQSPQENIIYLVPSQDGDNPNLFTEWIYVDSTWEMFGSPKINLDDYITDVTINGTSVVTDGVAEIPVTGVNILGLMKCPGNTYGIYRASDGTIFIASSSAAEIKAGASDYKPIVPLKQDQSVFYGLAKAAGSDEANSDLPVGQYTDSAKAAIQSMLGVDALVARSDTSPTTIFHQHNELFWFNGKLLRALQDMEAGTTIVTGSQGNAKIVTLADAMGMKVADVQVNGTSVLDGDVANIPVASSSTPGVVRTQYSYGTNMEIGTGVIYVVCAEDSHIKQATQQWRPIVPANQHTATFYGLAKAAGDTTQSQSNNAVGTYTDDAKSAIQTMLGVPSVDDIPDVPVTDVKINGTSIVDANGDADIPYASHNNAGAIKVYENNAFGVGVNADGYLYLRPTTLANAKSGSSSYYPVTTSIQHGAVFYGLSKAAGVDLANETVTLGTYPATSQAAIKSMIGVNVDDVQVNGTSIVSNGVANIPMATDSIAGAVIIGDGLQKGSSKLLTRPATDSQIKAGVKIYEPIVPSNQHKSTFYGLAKAAGADEANSALPMGQYTDTAKVAIRNMIGATGESATITVTGTDPVITAQSNARYICGEVLSLTFTPPATGICEVIFTSGSSVTVLDLPQTVMMPDWFEVETNKTYDISIVDGIYGAVMSW